ncbi:TDP-N-acetylfucosamine:lipid II N-acetylfucosaminyltransferase [Aliarcobacter butzleri]|uniref:TDP-N-acetylfucosamine:lipid II N-acetylfucosaminyltransferase n=1 Tax=Aliarcobacter butzleri TaxID=28197 RepID=UPI001EE0C245|nr:TDP-N-acetylfucosamine:lipid II N-acetylfucosaminyltransferase [Aliarcobacter butzleri]MCG3704499.1 TDP-N-acetylfucosamine:lipid II N-acetylfucosaminyltransferase [Aliarcobacter butzleri]
MNENKILHVMILDKFLAPYIDFVDEHFGRVDHHYVFITSEKYDYGLTPKHKVEFLHTDDDIFITLLEYMKMAKKIILHGLWRDKVDVLLYFNQELLKKCYWVMWGGDFYFPETKSKIRHTIIKKIGFLTTTVPDDYLLVKKWYNTTAIFIHNLMYPSHIYRDFNICKCNMNKNQDIFIQVGNSADPSNNHIEVLDFLLRYKNKNIKIFCPLSYGSQEYKEKLISYGKKNFGEKFIPITTFLSFNEYNKYMACVDIAIFNHNRQQAMGNTIGLISLGKKVILKPNVTPFKFFKNLGIKIYSLEDNELLRLPSKKILESNIAIMKNYFNLNRLKRNWSEIFHE